QAGPPAPAENRGLSRDPRGRDPQGDRFLERAAAEVSLRTIGVLGCGQMGGGIAQVAAVAGFDVIARDLNAGLLAAGRSAITKSRDRLVEKGKLEAPARDVALGHLQLTTALGELSRCDLVIEAVSEDLELKNGLWRELDTLCPRETIFASNTSSLSIMAM